MFILLGIQMGMLALLHLQRGPGGNYPICWGLLQQQPAAGQRRVSGRDSKGYAGPGEAGEETSHSRGSLGGYKMRFEGTENRPYGVHRGECLDQVGGSV